MPYNTYSGFELNLLTDMYLTPYLIIAIYQNHVTPTPMKPAQVGFRIRDTFAAQQNKRQKSFPVLIIS